MGAAAAGGCCRVQKNNIPGGGAKVVTYQWADCGRDVVSRRYDRIAKFIPVFDWLFFVPWDLRRKAVRTMRLSRGDSVLEIGCGTGRNFAYLREAVGPEGRIFGVDISPGMLRQAERLREVNNWRNIALRECDAADYTATCAARRRAVQPVLQYHAASSHRAAARLAAASSGRPSRHHGRQGAAGMGRTPGVAVQPLADEAHHARQSADSPVARARRRRRRCRHERVHVQLVLHLLRHKTVRRRRNKRSRSERQRGAPIPPTASPRSDDPAQRRRSPKARPPLVAMRPSPVHFAGRR